MWTSLAIIFAAPCTLLKAEPKTEPPAVTRAQIEADWLHQDAKRQSPALPGGGVSREEDAAGAVDGVKNGKWGFHTEMQDDPWWQVDLGKPTAIGRLVLYNRCDLAERNARIIAWLSDDAKTWRQVYQHNGKVFYGHTDKKPLTVDLKGQQARYVRLGLKGKSYFHLDEVEILAPGRTQNAALGKPATQSTTSIWSARAVRPGSPGGPTRETIVRTIERGRKLAESQRRLGVKVDAEVKALEEVAAQVKNLPDSAPDSARRDLYFRAHWAVRKMALANPLLNFDSLVFCKAAPTRFPHMSDQFYGWWSRPGGGICILDGFKSLSQTSEVSKTSEVCAPKVRCLTSSWALGSFIRPDLSYDGKRIIFAYAKSYAHVPDVRDKATKGNLPEDSYYHIFEMNVDGSGVRQLTRGRYDDFDARYLPNGEIVFLSTRKGVSLQMCKTSTGATAAADLPDSYVRCGGDNWRPVPVFTLHAMDADGKNLRPMSAFENFEWTPSVANDGRVVYCRWDYIDRFNGHFFSLWSTNPDGTNPQLVYKNFTVRPQVASEAVSIPGSHKLVFTASAHHSILGGSLVLFDRTRGTEEASPIVRLTPEVPFPETESWADHYYANPWPLSEEYYLVGWADRRLPPHTRIETQEANPVNAMGLYLYDAFGNQELLYRDPEISSGNPIPLRARPKPAVYANQIADRAHEGRFFLQDVYLGLTGIPRGTVKRLRIVAVPPKVQPHMNTPNLGVSAEDPGKYVLGTAPVESDGSAFFRVPSGVPVFFQALDSNGLAVQTMRSLTYVQPKQTLSCIGCHEHRDLAPSISKSPLAGLREPSKLTPGPSGSWPLRFDELVQPVLDRHCVRCHKPGSDDAKAAKSDLTPAKAYQTLLTFGGEDLKKKAFERDRSIPGECTAATSKLWALVTQDKGHEGVVLDAESRDRLATWMDTYAQQRGSFSEAQEKELRQIRKTWADLFSLR
jgi:hypothetical protein